MYRATTTSLPYLHSCYLCSLQRVDPYPTSVVDSNAYSDTHENEYTHSFSKDTSNEYTRSFCRHMNRNKSNAHDV